MKREWPKKQKGTALSRCPSAPLVWLPQHSRRPAVIRPATCLCNRKADARCFPEEMGLFSQNTALEERRLRGLNYRSGSWDLMASRGGRRLSRGESVGAATGHVM